MSAKSFIKGTFILTLTGIITRLLGFVFKIILSRIIGSEGMGMYQLVMPVCGIAYALGISGFEVAISRLTAKHFNAGKPEKALTVLVLGSFYSLVVCITFCMLVTINAECIANKIFGNSDVTPLIKTIIWSIPFSAIHCMVSSYYIGQQKTGFPGISQLLEQLIRMLSVFVIIKITNKTDATIGVISLIIGEIGAAIISVNYVLFNTNRKKSLLKESFSYHTKAIRKTAIPVSLNKIALVGLQSLETILLPIMLVKNGLSHTEAVQTLGIITGMAIPVILFPATLTNSVALMLLPSVSTINQNPEKLKKSGSYSLIFSLIFGFICIIFMVMIGGKICEIAFKEPLVNEYVKVLAWLCPFIFVSTTFKSILNALGKSTKIFANNMLSETINIVFIIFLIPTYGIGAYLYGLLTSQCLNSILQLVAYNNYMRKLR